MLEITIEDFEKAKLVTWDFAFNAHAMEMVGKTSSLHKIINDFKDEPRVSNSLFHFSYPV